MKTQMAPSERAVDQKQSLDAAAGRSTVSKGRLWAIGVLLFLAVASALGVSVWGFLSSLTAEPEPARIGEEARVSGGFVRVDEVTPEHMAPMQSDKFAQSGMNMSAMGMDMAPEGQRRFAVEVTLAASGGSGLAYSPESFRLTGDGTEETEPLRAKLGDGVVPKGSTTSGSLVFQVPEEAENLMLTFDGGDPVALDLPPMTEDDDHSHGAGQEENGGQPDSGEEEQSDHDH